MDMDPSPLNGWLAAVRAVHFAACLLIGGTWFFDRVIVPRPAVERWRWIAGWMLLIAVPLALVTGALWWALVAADLNDEPFTAVLSDRTGLSLVWSRTHFGRVWQIHTWCLVAVAVTAAGWLSFRRLGWIGLFAAAGMVASLAWAGHGVTGPAPVWHLTADVLHLLASAVWPGGLVLFLLLLRSVSRSHDADRWRIAVELTRRFSASSFFALLAILATGIVSSWALVGSFPGMGNTAYGRLLCAKIILFGGMIGFGAFNMLVLKPRLERGESTVRKLMASVSIETVIAAMVMAAVGCLGLLEPARQPPARRRCRMSRRGQWQRFTAAGAGSRPSIWFTGTSCWTTRTSPDSWMR